MKHLHYETALAMHELLAKETGGDTGVRDRGLLESALAAPMMSFGGTDLYPTTIEKCTRLGYTLIKNHAFADGNKRIGMLVLLTMLTANDLGITPTASDVTRIGLAVASGEMDYPALLKWVTEQQKRTAAP